MQYIWMICTSLVWIVALSTVTSVQGRATTPGAAAASAPSAAAASLAATTTTEEDEPPAAVAKDATTSSDEPQEEQGVALTFRAMHDKILQGKANGSGAFLAALDQSGGSTPKALASYGLTPEEGNYEVGAESMFDAVHQMRTRIMTSSSFAGDTILGAILFEDTMDRTVNDLPTCQYLWERKGVVPFLKIDKGLKPLEDGIQMLNPIPNLEVLLARGRALGVYGTKARSLIVDPSHPEQIDSLVRQQFELARSVLKAGLVPIVEPEVSIDQESSSKQACEEVLCRALLRELEALRCEAENDDEEDRLHQVLIKITLPEVANQYQDCVDHPCCLRVVALSGGYDQGQAKTKLAENRGIIASFSRALSEGLSHGMTDEEFDACLGTSISAIYEASEAAGDNSVTNTE